uniref:Deoxyribose-phosphate aldolase n=1 Tax=Paramoeba aestuarina TaxID=180227 RepID=A0A7S4UDS7_9EUKA|eukprot:CAMPEP_0201520432 /NCGR_PEP_ID=MMETSP0161_2-20130828/11240_1 /ASSEMBLY_ACC=CAM_ASM_000251 /TAXON_ID=180227 /ORGANISM="Neoparamoeba aestuarina, Strain SoJaBio B1-5/56/2" /LENGTH=316 /DNA_ID=CAMNT_0047918801 /DNA_START=12 /DNA_END=962 /DNA_ORIENTATION=+
MAHNKGIPFDLSLINSTVINKPCVNARAAELPGRRCVKKQHQVAWMLRAVQCIDLTTLSGDDTPGNVKRLCAKSRNAVQRETLDALGLPADFTITTGAVCVYPNRVADAVKALEGTNIPVASVATGFPAGQTPLDTRLAEIKFAVEQGAKEIDIVLNRTLVFEGKWEEIYDEVVAMKKACGTAHLKTILATGEFPHYTAIWQASMVCMMAGADFIKTSTGKEPVNAVIPVGLIMCRAIREYYELTGFKVGFKPAGGIRTAKDSCLWLALMMEELGEEWTHPHLFRIGASSLLQDLERQLYHSATGRYHGKQYIPLS